MTEWKDRKITRPDVCPCENEKPDPCPACGATISGDDIVQGICQAKYPTHQLTDDGISLVLLDKKR